jgi:hypothetical protein
MQGINLELAMRFLLLFVCTGVASCTVPAHAVLTNSSASSAALTFVNDSGRQESLSLPVGGTVEVKGLLEARFSIRQERKTHVYKMRPVPVVYIDHAGFGPFFKRVVKAELKSDHCVYLIRIETDVSVQVQPDGFPLCPDESQHFPSA